MYRRGCIPAGGGAAAAVAAGRALAGWGGAVEGSQVSVRPTLNVITCNKQK